MNYKQYILDPFQEESVEAIENNQSVVVSAPTGSGKTLIADYIIEKHKNDQKQIIYTAPIKALSNQKYKNFSEEYGSDKVGLMTGDVVINPFAKILVMTTEIYRNMVISKDKEVENVAYVIFDEIHYINDIERGYVWEESIIYSPKQVRFLCLSATIPNALEFSRWIKAIKKHPVKTVIATHRSVPLEKLFYDEELGLTTAEKIKEVKNIPDYYRTLNKKGKRNKIPEPDHLELIKELNPDKLPALFFHFSRNACQKKAVELSKRNILQISPQDKKEIIEYINYKLERAPSDIHRLESTRLLKETLPKGVGFHHAGLLPILKEIVEDLFSKGLLKVLYVTETFAVGINMPAKTVCFDSLRKFDGYGFRNLNTKEFFQIAGRAGRRGIDQIGYVIIQIYRPTFKYNEVMSITTADTDPIKSQFKLSVNTVLNLINQHTDEEIEHILRLSFFSYQKFGEDYDKVPTKVLLSRYNSIRRKLEKFGFVKNRMLTEKGIFSSKVFADEITLGEIFSTDFKDDLDEYQILLLLAAIVYERRELEVKKKNKEADPEELNKLWRKIYQNEHLQKEKKFLLLNKMMIFIHPIYYGQSFFDVLQLTDFLEGDLIRIYAQILDRIGQIRKATHDIVLINHLDNCQKIIRNALEGISLV